MPGPQRISEGKAAEGVNPKRNKNSSNLGKSSRLLADTETLKRGKTNTIQRRTDKLIPAKQIKLFWLTIGLILVPGSKTASEIAIPKDKQQIINGTMIIVSMNIFQRGA